MNRDAIATILADHAAWLADNTKGKRAALSGTNLNGANLAGAALAGAYLGGANLYGADLGCADLREAYLGEANLCGAYLGDADLRGAYLRGTNLHGANLHGANLHGAYLHGAYLRGAYLRGAKGVPPMSEFSDDVVVTDHEPRAPRPDNTGDLDAAEDRAQKTIKDLDAGLVSRRTATSVKHAAKRAVGGYDLSRSVGKL